MKNEVKKRNLFHKVINIFISFVLFFIILVILFFGFSQTSTFRNILKGQIISIADSALYGKLSIGEIDGSIFSSLIIRDVSITLDNEKLLDAKKIEVLTSPLRLLFKTIYVRKILLEDININILQKADSTWNIKKLVRPTEDDKDSTESSFPFIIELPDIEFSNINLARISYNNRDSKISPLFFDAENLVIENFNFSSAAYINLNKNDFRVSINKTEFKTNIYNFDLINFSSDIYLNDKFILVDNLDLETSSSRIFLAAKIDSLNIFDKNNTLELAKLPVSLKLRADRFDFDDLYRIFPAVDMLKGKMKIDLSADGFLQELIIDKFNLDYLGTQLKLKGKLLNIGSNDPMLINASIDNSVLDYSDIKKLLPKYSLPEYHGLILKNLNITFDGEPIKFNAELSSKLDKGSLNTKMFLDFSKDKMIYDIILNTLNLDLYPVINKSTNITSIFNIKGEGTNPNDLDANLNMLISNSNIDNYNLETVSLNSTAKNKVIKLNFKGNLNGASYSTESEINFTDSDLPNYYLSGNLSNLDLESILEDSVYKSDLNFYFSLEGENFDIDRMNSKFIINLLPSTIREDSLDESILELTIDSKDQNERRIELISQLFDFNIYGNFSLANAIGLIGYEAATITEIIIDKIDELNPANVLDKTQDISVSENILIPEIVDSSLEVNFDFSLKDFSLISKFTGTTDINIEGSGDGTISNDSSNFRIATDFDIDYFLFSNQSNPFYIFGLTSSINFIRDNASNKFDNLFGSLVLSTERFINGADIRNTEIDLIFNQSKIFYNIYSQYDTLVKADISGNIAMTPIKQTFLFDRIVLNYKGYRWENTEEVTTSFSKNLLKISNFNLSDGQSIFSLNGSIDDQGNQDLKINGFNLTGDFIDKYIFNTTNSNLKTNANIEASISGFLSKPLIDINLNVNDITYLNRNFGYMNCKINYSDKNLITQLSVLDSTANEDKPLLTLNGNLPIDLAFMSIERRLLEDKPMNFTLKSENLNIATFGNTLPFILSPSGLLNADISITGTPGDAIFDGFLELNNGIFRASPNNLVYGVNTRFELTGKEILLKFFDIENMDALKDKGKMSTYGSIRFRGLELSSIDLKTSGDLAVLANKSNSSSPMLYGDLFIGTNNDWVFTYSKNSFYFLGNILVKNANLTFEAKETSNNIGSNGFIYKFMRDSLSINLREEQIQKIIAESRRSENNSVLFRDRNSNFDYDIGISIVNDAKINFILSKELNQNLKVEARGNLRYEIQNGEPVAQGEIELLEGSTLEFFKTFDAAGSIKFENDITDPYLDVNATYIGDHAPIGDTTGVTQEVAVKINISGAFSELSSNLRESQDNILVYYGRRNIENNTSDSRYDASDALSFIIFGKFISELTAGDKGSGNTFVPSSMATSFLGSYLSSFVNQAFGDAVRNIQLRQTATNTRFNVSGKFENFRYTIGGTTEVFQDIDRASIKIEYNFNPNFIIRVERKDPIYSTFGSEIKINELGIKYRFLF